MTKYLSISSLLNTSASADAGDAGDADDSQRRLGNKPYPPRTNSTDSGLAHSTKPEAHMAPQQNQQHASLLHSVAVAAETPVPTVTDTEGQQHLSPPQSLQQHQKQLQQQLQQQQQKQQQQLGQAMLVSPPPHHCQQQVTFQQQQHQQIPPPPPPFGAQYSVPPPHNALPSAPQHHGAVVYPPGLIRVQPGYSVYDYRYWPYPQHGFPGPMPHHPLPPLPPHMYPTPSAYYASMSATATSDSNGDQKQVPWRRQRRSKACLHCHMKKIKCEGDGPACMNCLRNGIDCQWVQTKKRGPKPKAKTTGTPPRQKDAEDAKDAANQPLLQSSTISSPTSIDINSPAVTSSEQDTMSPALTVSTSAVGENESKSSGTLSSGAAAIPSAMSTPLVAAPLPAISVRRPREPMPFDELMRQFHSDKVPKESRDAVTFYFDYFYGVCPIFHPATFIRRLIDGEIDPILIDSMRATTARIMSKHTGQHIDVEQLMTDVKERLLLGLDRPTVDYVRAVVIMASLAGGEGQFISYNSLTCLATSLITRLGWHMMDLNKRAEGMPWDEWCEQEIKRRTYWVTYQIDSYQGYLADRQMTLPVSRLYIWPPGCDPVWEDVSVPQITEWPTQHSPAVSEEYLSETGCMSYAFVEMTELTRIITRFNGFLWDVKINNMVQLSNPAYTAQYQFLDCPDPVDMPRLARNGTLTDYAEFVRLSDTLFAWRDRLVPAEKLRSGAAPMRDISEFGSLSHRRFLTRVRFFCLRCYFTPMIIGFHQCNRPSFFLDPENMSSRGTPGVPDRASPAKSDCIEDSVIREMLGMAFADNWNDGLRAYDVNEDSWNVCVREAYDLERHLDRNSDIPMDRCDQVMPLCLFTVITVLLRQIRMCKRKINDGAPNERALLAEVSNCGRLLRRYWTMLQDLGFMWGVKGMEQLLRVMQIDEIANAADMFSGLSL